MKVVLCIGSSSNIKASRQLVEEIHSMDANEKLD